MAAAGAVWCGYVDVGACLLAVINNWLPVVQVLLVSALGLSPLAHAECQTNQTVSGQEVCEEEDDSNGAFNLMER